MPSSRRRLAPIQVLAIAVIAAFAGGDALESQTTPSAAVQGRLVDAISGAPIAGATVTMTGPAVGRALMPDGLPRGSGFAARRTETDVDGGFAFDGLGPGEATLSARATGYLLARFGTERPRGTGEQIVLESGGRRHGLVIRAWPEAVITGRITGQDGTPINSATVWAQPVTTSQGMPRLGHPQSAASNSRGEYEIVGLPPGDYVVRLPSVVATLPADVPPGKLVAATRQAHGVTGDAAGTTIGDRRVFLLQQPTIPHEPGRFQVYPTTFYPGVRQTLGATSLTLDAGDRAAAIDMQRVPEDGVRVSGQLEGPAGPAAGLAVRLADLDVGPCLQPTRCETAVTQTDTAGHFVFEGVVPGNYEIRVADLPGPRFARKAATIYGFDVGGTFAVVRVDSDLRPMSPEPRAEPGLWARSMLSVSTTDVTDLVLRLEPASSLSGRVVLDGSTPPRRAAYGELPHVIVVLEPEGGEPWFTSEGLAQAIMPEGTFMLPNVAAGRYLVRVAGVPPEWALDSVRLAGRDVSLEPFDLAGDVQGTEVVLTDRPAVVSGTVSASIGDLDPDTAVVIVPVDRRRWAGGGSQPRDLQLTRPGADGRFEFRGLPPGEYYLAAVVIVDDDWRDPAVLSRLVGTAERLTVAAHAQVSRNVTAGR